MKDGKQTFIVSAFSFLMIIRSWGVIKQERVRLSHMVLHNRQPYTTSYILNDVFVRDPAIPRRIVFSQRAGVVAKIDDDTVQ